MKKLLMLALTAILPIGALAQTQFEIGQNYSVYIELSSTEYKQLKNLRILGISELGGVSFLKVSNDGFGGKKHEGLIRLDSVKAILSTESMRLTE